MEQAGGSALDHHVHRHARLGLSVLISEFWYKAQRPINARSETAAKSGMFRGALAQRRCIVHADAFYEWKVVEGGKQPYAIARQDGKPLAFAGIWESFRWSDETVHRSFAIMTTAPNAEMVGPAQPDASDP